MGEVLIAVTFDNGTIAITRFKTEGRSPTLPHGAVWKDEAGGWNREANDENIFAELVKTFPHVDQLGRPKPNFVSYKIVDSVPADRTYRDAWTFDGTAFDHDMEKARAIHLDRVRVARAMAFPALDAEFAKLSGQAMAADLAGDSKVKGDVVALALEVEQKRQALRDAPATLDVSKAATVEELKALWPADLQKL